MAERSLCDEAASFFSCAAIFSVSESLFFAAAKASSFVAMRPLSSSICAASGPALSASFLSSASLVTASASLAESRWRSSSSAALSASSEAITAESLSLETLAALVDASASA